MITLFDIIKFEIATMKNFSIMIDEKIFEIITAEIDEVKI